MDATELSDFLVGAIADYLNANTQNVDWHVRADVMRWDIIIRVTGTTVICGKEYVSKTDSQDIELDAIARVDSIDDTMRYIHHFIGDTAIAAVRRHKATVFGFIRYDWNSWKNDCNAPD